MPERAMEETSHTTQLSSTLWMGLKHYWMTGLLAASAVFLLTMYIVTIVKPLYTSKTTLILPYTPISELVQRNEVVGSPQSDPLILHSYLQIIKDDGIALEVIRKLRLVDNVEFAPTENILNSTIAAGEEYILGKAQNKAKKDAAFKEDGVLRLYKKRLNVEGGRALSVDISFQAHNPSLAAEIVNAHATAYLNAQVQFRRQQAQVKATWMEQQVDHGSKELYKAQMNVQLHQLSPRSTFTLNANDSTEFKYYLAILNSKQNVYQSLLNRQQVMLAEEQYNGADTRILSAARAAVRPSFPNKPLAVGLAALLGILTGIVAAFSLQMTADRRRGMVARLPDIGLKKLAFIEIPSSAAFSSKQIRQLRLALFWEQIRSVRTSLNIGRMPSKKNQPASLIAVTSAESNQASSLVAASLARAVASSGTSTLLLDLNLRRPNAHAYFNMATMNMGLQHCLKGGGAYKGAVQSVGDVDSLSFLGGGGGEGRDDIDILAGPAMKTLLGELRREFGAIIVDSPPLGVVCDSLVIADLVDDIVIVSDESSNFNLLKQAVLHLRGRNAAFRGVVVTSRRPASAQACHSLAGYVTNDKLSRVSPTPVKQRRRFRERLLVRPVVVAQVAE